MDKTEPMTYKEKEILYLMAAGYSSKEIATKMKHTISTLEFYRNRMIKRAGVKNSCELISWGYQQRILRVDNLNQQA